MFPKVLAENRNLTEEDSVIAVSGRVNYKDDGTAELMAEKISPLTPDDGRSVVLNVSDLSILDSINPVIKAHPGDSRLVIKSGERTWETVYYVRASNSFKLEIESFGAEICENI